LEYISQGHGVRHGINGYTDYAPPAYIISTAALEAFVNEVFISDWVRVTMRDSPMWNIPRDTLYRMELSLKLVIIPELLFQNSFSKGSPPYQDMTLLIRIRNEFVHYKMKMDPPKYLQTLDQRGISLSSPTVGEGDYPWPAKLSSSEGIRWAHNTVCSVVHELVRFESIYKSRNKSKDKKITMAKDLATNFLQIPDSFAIDWLTKKGVDPNSTYP